MTDNSWLRNWDAGGTQVSGVAYPQGPFKTLIRQDGYPLVLCRPSSAQKPRLGPGLRGLRLSKYLGRAKAPNDGRLRLG
jgi:hypothetical protein